MSDKRVYLFREGSAEQRDLLGGKGANLCEMTNIGLPVPPGFTITTDVCRAYYAEGGRLPAGLMAEVRNALSDVEKNLGKSFGQADNPLLVSVRSGAKFSMPGMMDTILNLGITQTAIPAIVRAGGSERFAWDSYRRFIMMFSNVVLGIEKKEFEEQLQALKTKKGVDYDSDLSAEDLKGLAATYFEMIPNFPKEPWDQLEQAIEAVFRSWNNDRAITYRREEDIPDDIGTAVTVQSMVFGNMGENSGTGVAFTRDPSTGEKNLYGEYLMNAQGEDVVAGIRTPQPISELAEQNPAIYEEFNKVCVILESHYRDMMDIEFTVQEGRLFVLQCRAGKRTGPAAVRAAVEMVGEKLINRDEAIHRVTAKHLDQLLHPRIDDKASAGASIASGLPASPGAAVGKAVFDADTAAALGEQGEKVILVRHETNPDDVHGMLASQGILTARGGKTSHAAVVARGFGIPCVAGCQAILVDESARSFSVDGKVVSAGDVITLDGTSGKVFLGEIRLIPPEVSGDFGTFMEWCDAVRSLGVRANADNPRDARQAIDFGAEGIGLCRTEHMFFEKDRLPVVQQMILASDGEGRSLALDALLKHQQADFEAIFEVMGGLPVTIRLIDPPLHEFLPSHDELFVQITELRAANKIDAEKEKLLHAVEAMREANPMLGLRGVRLSILFPGIVEMQTRAILQAAAEVRKRGIEPHPEIMIPLVSHVNELKAVREQLEKVAAEVIAETGEQIPYKFGTMIELPRAALTAGEIAKYAEFFSFGTNDLTQTSFGFSRDDAEGKFLGIYVQQGILPVNPFESIDTAGVGRLMKICTAEGRETNPSLKIGICGEHGGDPASVEFCHSIGLDYVSCSPFRVPIARLAAAKAAAKQRTTVEVDV